MFLGAATRPTEDGPHFKKQHITSNNSRKFQGAGRRLQGTMKMEAGRWKREAKTSASDRAQVSGCKSQGLIARWKREAKTSASDRAQVSGCKSQGLTTTWKREDVIVAVNRKSNIGNRERL
jgi:hypothetical protein